MRKVLEPVMVASQESFNRLTIVGEGRSSSARSSAGNGWRRPAGQLLVASLLFWNSPAGADSIEDFYAGKQVQLIISTATGGGYDAYARALARHIGNHMPGKPVFVPQNMPGAGGLRASGYMFNSAPRDGTAIALIHGTMVTADLLLPDSAKFEPVRFSWIGNIESEAGFCAAWAESGFKTIADLKTREMIIGASGAGGESNLHPRMLMKLYGAKIRIVSGYGSSNNLALAMARREIDGRCGWTPSVFEANNLDWIRDHKINLLIQLGLAKHPRYTDIPLITEVVSDPDAKAALELLLAERQLLRPVLAPPGIPRERLDALRRAFDATMRDPAFLEETAKQALGVTPMTGEAVQDMVERLHHTSPAVVKVALDLVN